MPATPSARPAEPATAPSPGLPPAKPEQIPKQFGGYYKDDGPILEVPYDLDALPEPEVKLEPLNRFANKPYSVLGKTYTPKSPLVPYSAEGVASWYGKKFHGKRTSSGEPYDMFKLTAAHPVLPIPSYARVTSLDTGKSVVVRVNDRGPFHKGRLIDLSYAAAYRLGYHNGGSARVRVEALVPGQDRKPSTPELALVQSVEASAGRLPEPAMDDAPTGAAGPQGATPAGDPAGGDPLARLAIEAPAQAELSGDRRWVQLGAFASQIAAEAFRSKVAEALNGVAGAPVIEPGGGVWRVRVGPFASRGEAQQAAERIASSADLRPVVVR
ncbi:septal ring lytic transglycosylase RlpA family protein [Chitinimonas koreensis]|uniref:septal ring lytic transglycosylase RlpA family protein n=1 Tax=Chitinimonas koreensis TaxID=356302 RepID=UPI0016547618|nr:septal ring lytic transglycosylase RlpA family protein [Chitinimonas koreensis]QNM96820.1 septal ring lytic transglycosylase RlpA family protein [Chitinimonas koreensis]